VPAPDPARLKEKHKYVERVIAHDLTCVYAILVAKYN